MAQVRRLDVGHEPGLEALAQAVLERLQVVGRTVGGEHDLASAVVQGVEGVEELLLGLGLALEELDVVEEQHVDVAEAGLEGVGVAAAERAEELVGEGLAGGAADRQPGAVGEQEVRDRAEQVGLADAGRAADEQRVVGLGRHLGDGERGGVREAVAVADDELVEGELGVAERSARAALGPSAGGARRARPGRRRTQARRRWRRASTTTSGPSTRADAGLEHPAEALADPPAGLWGRFDEQALVGELASAQRLQPDAIGRLVDARAQARLCTRDHMCSSSALTAAFSPLLFRRKTQHVLSSGARGGPGQATIPDALQAHLRRLAAIGGKFRRARRRSYTSTPRSGRACARRLRRQEDHRRAAKTT